MLYQLTKWTNSIGAVFSSYLLLFLPLEVLSGSMAKPEEVFSKLALANNLLFSTSQLVTILGNHL